MIFGIGLLFISLIVANAGVIDACPEDAMLCPDGTVLARDPGLDCEFPECPNLDLLPYCTENVVVVEKSGDYIKTVGSLLGAGFTVYDANVTHCPVVGPDYITPECNDFMNLEWNQTVNCSNVVDFEVYACPTDYNVIEGEKWISCEEPVVPKFTDYCQPITANGSCITALTYNY